MPRILIAGSNERIRTQMSRILTSSGLSIFRCCASGGEVRRAMSECDRALLVLAGMLPDTSPEALLTDFKHQLEILMIAKPSTIAEHTSRGLFHLSYPCSGNLLLGAIEMLLQMQVMNHPQRTAPERLLVEQAKEHLMMYHSMSEPEAHRHIQTYAMSHGIKMTDYAQQILEKAEQNAETTNDFLL